LDAEKSLFAGCINRRFWKARCAVNIIGFQRCDRRYLGYPFQERWTRVGGGSSIGFVRSKFVQPGLLHVHAHKNWKHDKKATFLFQ
jgi:hypothetical protein